ncbi:MULTISPECIES: hypothetical protein [Rhodobacterales]|jgi:hypothetical protein|nr:MULTISPECIES: hypothetical protein [Rhodobacterales]WJY21043.1 hypothetical protein QTA57_14780 [Fontisubflavum oceani]
MGRLIKLLAVLIVLAVIGLVGYSYSGLMVPETREITVPVVLDAD